MPVNRPQVRLLIATLVASVLISIVGTGTASAQAPRAFVLSNNTLFAFDTADPTALGAPVTLTGLNAGDTLVAIDIRPQNGFLYGLGYNGGAGTVQLYALSYRGGVAAPIGPTGTFVAADGTTPVPIQGTAFGFDFNPTVDRIRVVNDAGQNFRMNPNTGAFIDGDLGGAPGSVPGLNMDGPINGAATEVSGAAYTNNEQNATVTTLYTLGAATDTLYIQNPTNDGTQTLPKAVTLNGAPLDFTAANGFDIPPNVDVATNNVVASGSGMAALTVGGVSSLYAIDLTSGAATLLGSIGNGSVPIQGLAVQGETIFGGLPAIALRNNMLLRFNTMTPGTVTSVTTSGTVGNERWVGLDWRPQTGQLYGIGFDSFSGNGGSATLYRLDPQTGAATTINTFTSNGVPLNLTQAADFGVDFDPNTDSVRIVTNTGLNFRVNPDDGTFAGADAALFGPNYPGALTGLAFIGNFAKRVPDVFGVRPFGLGYINRQLYSSTGGLTNVTVDGTALQFEFNNGFDIPPTVSSTAVDNSGAGQYAYAILRNAGVTKLYAIELPSGSAVDRGPLGGSSLAASGLTIGDGVVYPTVTTVTSSQNPASGTQPITFTATITPSHATGTIDVGVGGGVSNSQPCKKVPVVAGTATCMVSFIAPGSFNVGATYSGDQNHSRSTGTFTQTMNMGTAPSAITLLTTAPNPPQPGERIIYIAEVSPSNATGSVWLWVDGVRSYAQFVQRGTAVVLYASLNAGTHTITAQYRGDLIYAPSAIASFTVTVTAPAPNTFTQYFAEGATGNFFHTDLGIFNASRTDPAHVNVTVFPDSGAAIPLPTITLTPLGRQTIDLNQTVGNLVGISMLVESDQPVAATRQMTWGSPVYGSTLESGALQPRKDWYFAEGATNVFSLFYLVENPNGTDANVTLTHLLEGGAAPVVETEVVPAFTRRTFYINDVPGLRYAAMSTIVTSDQPIVAERAMYLNTSNRLWEGGASNRGAVAPSLNWAFAEGSGGFFHTYLLLANPNQGSTPVNVRYLLQDGSTIDKAYDVAGRSRRTVDVNAEDPALAAGSYGINVSTWGLPIVAERAMWWGDPWTDGSAALGTTSEAPTWAIGEGAEGGAAAEATFVLITHPPAPYDGGIDYNPAPVRLTVAYDDGTHEEKVYNVPADSRLTVRIGTDFPNAQDKRFSVLVESIGASFASGIPYVITVESARYQSPGAFLDAGGAALATKIK